MNRLELQIAVDAGMSIAQLAERFECSIATVRYWLKKNDLKTKRSGARSQGVIRSCCKHGEAVFVREGSGYFRCTSCRSEAVAKRRRKVKEVLVIEAGGECVICGYSRSIRALEFHHLDRTMKRFGLSSGGITMSLDAARAEAAKCVLLCSNCHAEVEDGLTHVSLELGPAAP